MTFAELVTEFMARGFDYLGTTAGEVRAKRWINDAYQEITDYADWPFLEATAEGTAPLSVTELGHVLSAANKTVESPLKPVDRRNIVQSFDPALKMTGTAYLWYREGETTIAVWPGDTTSTIAVRYVKKPPELSATSDVPVLPTRFHSLIVDGAAVRAYKDKDNFEAGQFVRQEWERGLKQMVNALLQPNHDSDQLVRRTGYLTDYL